jgi:hypothetical protein
MVVVLVSGISLKMMGDLPAAIAEKITAGIPIIARRKTSTRKLAKKSRGRNGKELTEDTTDFERWFFTCVFIF